MVLDHSTQDGGMDAETFFEKAKQADFPDEMAFQIRVNNPENELSFSREGIVDTVDLIQSFIMARILGQWKKTGKPPKVMNMHLSIAWENDDNIAESFLPYFDADINEGLTQIDSQYRDSRR